MLLIKFAAMMRELKMDEIEEPKIDSSIIIKL